MPFAAAAADGVLTLTLDTPGSPINIFNHATARQLIEILSDVNPSTTQAIVFETAKPSSFINGVGLLLAHASQSRDDVVRASIPPWTAYRAVRDAPVPTIAVVQGNCFGCGVEFALSCDYRIAADTCETQFYMTELNDYLFIPLFGSTWNLPAAVGLADAIDLLLWGDRWGAEKAYQRGLIDEVAPYDDLVARKQRFVHRVRGATQPSRRRGRVRWGVDEEAIMEQARRRIASLPPDYQHVYADALGLLEAGARQTRTYVDHQRQELACSAASALSPLGKSAYAFFYLRQIASERAAGRVRGSGAPVTLGCAIGGDDDARTFTDDLRCRTLPGVAFADADRADFRLVAPRRVGREAPPRASHHGRASECAPPSRNGNGRGHEVAVQLALAPGPQADTEIYTPTYRAGGRLIELAVQQGSQLGERDAQLLARALQRLGFEVARTTPAGTFVSNRLLFAYLSPLVRFIELYDDVGILNGQLRRAGFVRRPHDLLAALDRRALAEQLGAELGRAPSNLEPLLAALESPHYADAPGDGVVIDAVCITLLDAVLTMRVRKDIRDLSSADLIARELLDFPRHLSSMCTWLKRSRVARALEGAARIRALLTETAVESARTFVAEGREFYR